MTKTKKTIRKPAMISLAEVRKAVATYIGSEGCECCEGGDHCEHKAKLGKLLKVRKYKDLSGYDFKSYAK